MRWTPRAAQKLIVWSLGFRSPPICNLVERLKIEPAVYTQRVPRRDAISCLINDVVAGLSMTASRKDPLTLRLCSHVKITEINVVSTTANSGRILEAFCPNDGLYLNIIFGSREYEERRNQKHEIKSHNVVTTLG